MPSLVPAVNKHDCCVIIIMTKEKKNCRGGLDMPKKFTADYGQ